MKTIFAKNKASLHNREWGSTTRPACKQRPYSLLPTPYSLFFLLFSLFFLLLGCEQPFKAGLGPIIDLQAPEITLTEPDSPSYIRGTVTFKGVASDDTQLKSVWYQISNYPDVPLPGEKYYHALGTFYSLGNVGTVRNLSWSFILDTKLEIDDFTVASGKKRAFLEGGSLKIRLLVIDHIGKENANVSSEYAFIIKNEGPQITVDNPPIKNGKAPGYLGGDLLNYGMLSGKQDKDGNDPWTVPYGRVIYKKEKVTGSISDDEGINYNITSPGSATSKELFPPQIRFWEVSSKDYIWDVTASGWTSETGELVLGEDGKPDTWAYWKGYFPSIEEVPWVDLTVANKTLQVVDDKHAIFEYGPMEETGKYYGFEIRAQSIDKVKSGVRYPASYYLYQDGSELYGYVNANLQFQGPPAIIAPEATPTSDGKPHVSAVVNQRENSYVLFTVSERQEPLILELYGLFDYGKTGWTALSSWSDRLTVAPPENMGLQNIYDPYYEPGSGGSNVLKGYQPLKIEPQDITDRRHPIVDTINVTKGGPFTLRMKASHSGGIKSAEVYWEKDDERDIRGRFIWDPADKLYGEYQSLQSLWNPGAFVGPTEYYTEWGLKEPNNNVRVRSFSFTYHDDPVTSLKDWPLGDRLGPGYGVMSGKSKVQRLKTGQDYDPVTGDRYDFNTLEGKKPDKDSEGVWDNYRLPDGKYNVKVYATGNGGAMAGPYELTITIDRNPPTIQLLDIDGKVDELVFKSTATNPNEKEPLEKAVTVNGVIRPSFLFDDPNATDTGFRSGSIKYFQRVKTNPNIKPPQYEQPYPDYISGAYYPEQAFIVISDTPAQKAAMDAYLTAHNNWPDFPDQEPHTLTSWTLGGVPILQHGPIDTSSCRILTSSNYEAYKEPPPTTAEGLFKPLTDGTYRVYVFARDAAFMGRSISFPIKVDFKSDNPELSGYEESISTSVKDPNPSHDFPTMKTGDGFIISGDNVVNKFNDNSYIKLTLKDDDGLDLGVQGISGDASKLKVSITKTKTDYDKPSDTITITELLPACDVPDADIKQAFPPQSVSSWPRVAVREKSGTITQEMLLNGLKTSGSYNNTNTLPDGIYKVDISIQDDVKLKLVMPDRDPASNSANQAKEKTDSVSFWIVVDNKDPVIEIKYNTATLLNLTRPSGSAILKDGVNPLVGSVSDENGPITLSDWSVQNGKGIVVSDMAHPDGLPGFTKPPYVAVTDWTDVKWTAPTLTYDFNYTMEMNGNTEDTYTFTVEFQDRFGGKSSVSLTYIADDEPPTVTLTKLIDIFSRNFDDVIIDNRTTRPGWTKGMPDEEAEALSGYANTYSHQVSGSSTNKDRLAVKVVTFSVNAVDNSGKVAGIRWWLLPADVGSSSTATAFNVTPGIGGQVADFDSFPAKELYSAGQAVPGTYYSSEKVGTLPGFNVGAYGVVDVKNGQFTIAVNTQKMLPVNGEYRLHIIAIDEAGNESRSSSVGLAVNLFQEVFFLQEEDKPYFDMSISMGSSNREPEDAIVKDQEWPTNAPALGGTPVVRGTIWENNGFLSDYSPGAGFWDKSITVWFSKTGEPPPSTWNDLVAAGDSFGDPANWEGPITILESALSKQGRNIYLSIPLATIFPNGLKEDGKKRFIIKATDSPVNKYKVDTLPNLGGILLGQGGAGTDEDSRVSRWRQYAFTYDAVPPEVEIINPKNQRKFGTNFTDTTASVDPEVVPYMNGFQLVGTIYDENLDKLGNGNYYFKYYLDSNASKINTFELPPGSTGDVTVIEGLPNSDGKPRQVSFNISPNVVAAKIIPDFNTLSDGQHSLNIFAWDESGKQGNAFVTFIKDTKPPIIAFTNLTGDNRPYDITNKSKVAINWWTGMTPDTKKNLLLGNSPNSPLPLTTLSYDSGVPELRGTITDLVSNIALTVDSTNYGDVGSGEVNIPTSNFRYWIDADPTTVVAPTDNAHYLATIDGYPGRSVRWTINLTNDRTNTSVTPLYDGVHTIALTAADEASIPIPVPLSDTPPGTNQYVIAFRIDHKPPTATVSVIDIDNTPIPSGTKVYGNTAYQKDPMFSIKLLADDANLKQMKMRIRNTTKNTEEPEVIFSPQLNTAWDEWTYTPGQSSPSIKDDNVHFEKTYPISKTKFTDSGKYDIIVTAEDWAGYKSEEYVWSFTYDKDAPEIEFTNPDDVNKTLKTYANLVPRDFIDLNNIDPAPQTVFAGPPPRTINRLTSQNLRIQGNVKDKDDFSGIILVQSKVERWNWDAASDTAGWVLVEDWTPLLNDPTNKQTQIAWTKNLMGQNTQNGQTPVMPDLDLSKIDPVNNPSGEGLYRIQIRAKDASTTATGTIPGAPNFEWNYTSDMGNPALSDYMYFYYDRTVPELKITNISGIDANATYFPKPPGGFSFSGTIKDANRFAKVEVKLVTVGGQERTKTIDPLNYNRGAESQDWTATFADAQGSSFPDGRYTLTVTAYDMVGRSSKYEQKFILDSTAPWAKFTLPTKVKDTGYGQDKDTAPNPYENFASVIVNGGETAIITGETGDKPNKADPAINLPAGEQGSESGIDKMWFHLGYIDGITNNTNYPFPTKAAIEADEVRMIIAFAAAEGKTLTAAQVRGTATGLPGDENLTPKERNDWLDKVSEYSLNDSGNTDTARGNAWFRLGGTHKPTGFTIENPNIYDWRMEIPNRLPVITSAHPDYQDYVKTERNGSSITSVPGDTSKGYEIGGLKLYGEKIWIKGREYTVGPASTCQMVRSVDGQAGVYRLPLWIRLVDIAGNVEYYCHDIWIYPDGDIPTTTIESPKNTTKDSARGGSISVDGVARSNTSVYDVIFRVFADSVSTSNFDGTNENAPDSADALGAYPTRTETTRVKIPNYPIVTDTGIISELTRIGYNTSSWQRANLTLPGGTGEPLIPWSVMLNSEQEIRSLIRDSGFKDGGSATNNKIRVWLEVFVFNGEGTPIRSSIYANDGKGTAGNPTPPLYGTANTDNGGPGPKPYVRAFYLQESAPEVTKPNVGSLDLGNTWRWNTEVASNPLSGGYKGAGTEKGRRDKFAVRAVLDPKTSTVSEVSYRIKLDGGAYGTWTTMTRNAQGAFTPATPGVIISASANNSYIFEYRIDSKATTANANAANYAAINNGAWANSGGTITVSIRMKDGMSPPNEAEYAIQVGVDNFTPLEATDAEGKRYTGNPRVAGTNVDFMGRIYDYATTPTTDAMTTDYTPRRASKVYAWFMKNGQYINMNTGLPAAAAALPNGYEDIAALRNRTATVTYGNASQDIINSIAMINRGGANQPAYNDNNRVNIRVPKRRTTGATPEQAHNADWVREISESTATPGSKMLWSPVNSAVHDIRWSFTLDSTLLPDGYITLCYLVMDDAVLKADPTKPAAIIDGVNNVLTDASGNMLLPGNASYYEQIISVRNKYPQIERITLYTNNDGQGAAYTADAVQEYVINDYRSKMFANYTAPADNQFPTALAPGAVIPPLNKERNIRKADTTGYLNSGFISKNRYLGFKLETRNGNRPLNFKLQHVKRERVKLDSTELPKLLAAINSGGNNINLYTIAWHGDYSAANWKALGVTTENPTLGTHFVLQEPDGAVKYSDTAEVWKYTPVVTIPDVIAPNVTNNQQGASPSTVVEFPVTIPAANFQFSTTQFGAAATQINEYYGSHPDADDLTGDNPYDTAFFLIRVWDTVTQASEYGGVNERWVNDQLYDALVVGLNVYLTDKTSPTARLYDLNPYTETAVVGNNISDDNKNATIRNAANPTAVGSNIVRGGLFNTNTEIAPVRSGYIDPRNGSTALAPVNSPGLPPVSDFPLRVSGDQVTDGGNPARDQVSGRVILRGLVQDDQLVGQIFIKIGGDNEKSILRLTGGKMVATTGNENKAFAAETLHWKTGHTVEWAYVWDTETEPSGRGDGGGPSTAGVPIQVRAVDWNNGGTGNSSASVLQASVDIVPYITGFERETPKFTTKRSLQGWYSFYQGEANIALIGYNLGRTAGSSGVRIYLASANPGAGNHGTEITGGAFGSATALPENIRNRFAFTMPTNAVSGRLQVTVGASNIAAYNHTSSNTGKSWNSESNSYTPGSTLWINKPYAHIWRTINNDGDPRTYIGTQNNNASAGLEHPGMALEYQGSAAGRLHATWAVYGNAVPYYGTNNNSANALISNTPNEPALTPDISIFQGGGASAANIAYTSQDDGTASLWVKSLTDASGGASMQTSSAASTQRWKNIRISKALANNGTSNNDVGRIYMTANNAQDKSLWYGTRSGTSNSTVVIDGGGASGGVTGLGAVANAGEFSAVDYDNTGPIIAYYDQTNDTVRVALGNSSNQFSRNYLLPSGHALFRGSGKYISIKVDKDNHIHLAFYNSVYNTVVYYYAGSRTNISQNGTAPNGTTVICHTIDNVTTGGTWTDVSVDNNGNPWIVYGDSSRTGNYDGVRVAYRSAATNTGVQFTGTLRCPVTDTLITGWEALTMPANYTVKNDRLNIEVWPPTVRGGSLGVTNAPGNWNAAIGYPSDLFRVGYFFYPGWKGY